MANLKLLCIFWVTYTGALNGISSGKPTAEEIHHDAVTSASRKTSFNNISSHTKIVTQPSAKSQTQASTHLSTKHVTSGSHRTPSSHVILTQTPSIRKAISSHSKISTKKAIPLSSKQYEISTQNMPTKSRALYPSSTTTSHPVTMFTFTKSTSNVKKTSIRVSPVVSSTSAEAQSSTKSTALHGTSSSHLSKTSVYPPVVHSTVVQTATGTSSSNFTPTTLPVLSLTTKKNSNEPSTQKQGMHSTREVSVAVRTSQGQGNIKSTSVHQTHRSTHELNTNSSFIQTTPPHSQSRATSASTNTNSSSTNTGSLQTSVKGYSEGTRPTRTALSEQLPVVTSSKEPLGYHSQSVLAKKDIKYVALGVVFGFILIVFVTISIVVRHQHRAKFEKALDALDEKDPETIAASFHMMSAEDLVLDNSTGNDKDSTIKNPVFTHSEDSSKH